MRPFAEIFPDPNTLLQLEPEDVARYFEVSKRAAFDPSATPIQFCFDLSRWPIAFNVKSTTRGSIPRRHVTRGCSPDRWTAQIPPLSPRACASDRSRARW